MFKRPRGSKDQEAMASITNKRLKEDRFASPRHEGCNDDYASLTYSPRQNGFCNATNPVYQAAVRSPTSAGSTSPEVNAELVRYNRLKLQNKGGRRHEPRAQSDSDNSSISSEMSEVQNESCSREREHYNKLKVDVNKIQTNKKLRKGVKILAQPSKELSVVHSRSTQKSLRVLSVNNHLSSSMHDLVPVKYKKEGHAHQLHSVTRPRYLSPMMKPSHTSSSRRIPKSRSTDDILQRYGEDNGLIENEVLPHHISPSRSFQNICSTDSIPQLITTQASPEPSPSRSPLPHNTRPHVSASFMSKTITFLCTHEEKEIHSSAYEFSIKIAKGSVRKKRSFEAQVGVCSHGPFAFPKGYNLVSPIVMVTAPGNPRLRKSMELSLPFCMDLTPQSQKNGNIIFFRANPTTTKGTLSQYVFQPTNSDYNQFEIHNNCGKLRTPDLGFFCIMAKDNTENRRQTQYCVLPVVPRFVESSSWKVHYYVIHHLKALMREIEDGLGSNWEILAPKLFKLETRVGTQKKEKIEINFQKALPESGWTLSLESTSKVYLSDIDSWSNQLTRDNKLPRPPHFTIRVSGEHAASSSSAQVWFTGPGMSHDLTSQVNLQLKNTPLSSVYSLTLESLSSLSSTSIHLSPLVGSTLSNCSDYDHLPSQEELDQTHIQLTYHNGHIDFPTDEDLQAVASEVMRALDGDWLKLQASLEIPDYVLMDIQSQREQQQQVFRLLKQWRQHSQDSSKQELARILRRTDIRLDIAAGILLKY